MYVQLFMFLIRLILISCLMLDKPGWNVVFDSWEWITTAQIQMKSPVNYGPGYYVFQLYTWMHYGIEYFNKLFRVLWQFSFWQCGWWLTDFPSGLTIPVCGRCWNHSLIQTRQNQYTQLLLITALVQTRYPPHVHEKLSLVKIQNIC